MSFPRYSAYKDSGVPWLGSIPSHWEVHRLKSLFNLMKRDPREEDGIVTAFRDGEVTLRANRRVDGFTNAVQEIGYQGIRHGDLVIHAMDAFAGAIGVSDSDGKSTPVYSVCTPKRPWVDSWYYGLTLRHMALSGFVNSLAKGIRERSTEFRWADASVVILPMPPIEEQVAIKEFIAYETAKIDALVAEQERLIELLKEKREAVISHAVTKGLDPSVPMKDSGVAWLGEVPAHWEVVRLRFLCDIGTGNFDTADAVEGGEFPFFIRSESVERLNQFTHDCEAVLTSGDGAGVGKIFHHHVGKFAAHQRVYVFQNFRRVSGVFFHLYLASNFYKVALEGGAKSTVDSLRRPLIANFCTTVPPPEEQTQIVAAAKQLGAYYEALISEAEMAVELLLERRSALISAAVTGQIDVRGWVPALAVV